MTEEEMTFETSKGKILHLRVNDLGHKWGNEPDALYTEVVVVLSADKDKAFGFEIRVGDENLPSRVAMLDLLRDAFVHNLDVRLSYEIEPGRKTGHLRRVDTGPSADPTW